jgi:hypothetical protein
MRARVTSAVPGEFHRVLEQPSSKLHLSVIEGYRFLKTSLPGRRSGA